jgi:acyl-coenzyme A synthetase/AMP-(fatty) acid ligase
VEELLILAERARDARKPDAELARSVEEAVLARTGIRAGAVRILEPGTLPRTSSGKMRRAEALARFAAGTLAPPRKVNALSLARELLRSGRAYGRLRR